jgi:mannose-1-phosphate guanylyltransferase
MKAFLLAAGHGTRLRPITNSIPKCLVPIRGIPLLSIWLQLCKQFGIDEVLINTHAHGAMVRDYLREHSNGVRAQVVEEKQLLGSAGTLRNNKGWVAGENLFWVFYADVLCRPNLTEMLNLHLQRKPAATLGVYQVPDPKRCGIVTTDNDGIIQEFVEKPADPSGNWAFSGVMIGTAEVLNGIPEESPADIGFHVLPRLIGRMLAYRINSYMLDIGTMENYETAQKTWPGLSVQSE